MGNKRNRRPRQAQSPSLERDLSTSDFETSQGYETTIETLGTFENVDSVKEGQTAIVSGSQKEFELQVWSQKITEKTNKEVSDLMKETNKIWRKC